MGGRKARPYGTARCRKALTVRSRRINFFRSSRAFEGLYFGSSPASTKLHRVIQKSLLLSLGQTNRHLMRLISQAKLRGANKESVELEKAYSGQITAAALSAAL